VVSGGEDRVPRVVRVGRRSWFGGVGGFCVLLPGAGLELHPSDRAGAGGREVVPEAGFDVVDRGEYRWALRSEGVLGGGCLVDRLQFAGYAADRAAQPAS